MSLSGHGARHAQAFLGALGRLARSPFASVLTLLVIALALALPASLKLFINNAQLAMGGFANSVDLTVYLKTDVPLAKAEQLARAARERSEVAQVTLIPADQALEEFRKYSGFGAALEALQNNPLPHVLHIRPRLDAQSSVTLESLRHYLSAWPEVDTVQMDTEWVNRLHAILDVLQRLLAMAALLLGLGVLAIIGNTIRLEILNRRSEIEVTKLVGGSNAFVRRPFLYSGILYGVGGGLLAWAIVTAAVVVLGQPIATLSQLYGSQFTLQGLSQQEIGILVGTGVVLGWLGAWVSATRHLRAIEPRA